MGNVDVIIPVYNNITITLECIKSIYQTISSHINNIIIHDDHSNQDTENILAQLHQSHTASELLGGNIITSNITVIRSQENIGFAAGVNKACQLATAKYLFILNSDTKILDDILTPMLFVLESNKNIAAINPSGSVFKSKHLKSCLYNVIYDCTNDSGRSFGYIDSTNLSGYALLINKQIFESVNGFNQIYGRGYYEDTELSRVLINHNYKLAIYPSQAITHVGQSSFKQIKTCSNFAKELIQKNQKIYYSRFPNSKQKIDIFTWRSDFNKLPEQTKHNINQLVNNGATVTIHSFLRPKNLPYFQIKFKRIKLKELVNLFKF